MTVCRFRDRFGETFYKDADPYQPAWRIMKIDNPDDCDWKALAMGMGPPQVSRGTVVVFERFWILVPIGPLVSDLQPYAGPRADLIFVESGSTWRDPR